VSPSLVLGGECRSASAALLIEHTSIHDDILSGWVPDTWLQSV